MKNKLRAKGLNMSFKLNGELVDEMYSSGGGEKPDKSIETQEKKANQIKKMVLRKKIQAVSSGAGKEIMASKEVDGKMVDEGIEDILARLEKKRISKGGDPDASPLGKKTGRAMKAKQDEVRKKAGIKTEDINPFVQSSLEALGSVVKKNSNLGEEGYDHLRDRGMVRPSKDKKDGTSYPPSAEMKKTQKVNTGPSALDRVKKKYGKAVMDMGKK